MKKDKSKLENNIRDYEDIRYLLRDAYVYGCFNIDNYTRKGVSSSKYNRDKKRIVSYLPQDFLQERREGMKKVLYCSYNRVDSLNNDLAKTYFYKSFTQQDIVAYFCVLQLLYEQQRRNPGGIGKLNLTAIKNRFQTEGILIGDENFQKKLKELQEHGLIECVDKVYYLQKDLWKDFSDAELQQICEYLSFLKNVMPFSMPYYFLQNRLEKYYFSRTGKSIKLQDMFQFHHNHLFTIMDEEILLTCLCAIHKKCYLQLEIPVGDGMANVQVAPVSIIHNGKYGRQYLLAYDEKGDARTYRLDRVKNAELLEEMQITGEPSSNVADGCWCASGLGWNLTRVEIEFHFDEEKEYFIQKRIEREGHGGRLEKIGDGVYLYQIEVRDPVEMVPWIRSFGEHARVLASGEYRIEDRIEKDWKRVAQKYGII